MSDNQFRRFGRWLLPLLAGAFLAAGCGSGDSGGLDPALGNGNAEQIRKDYAALANKSADAVTIQAAEAPLLDPFAQEALAAVNAARAQARNCGDKAYPAVGPLQWDARAAHAALLESEWMLQSNSFGHAWPTGELVWDRLTMSGYAWRKADENIAAGYRSLADAMQAWIDSPPHCVALMRPDITEVAIAIVPGREGGAYLSYWTMVLATPQ
jgi:uncharacterized protein YkwD